jgi:hypothetical protein
MSYKSKFAFLVALIVVLQAAGIALASSRRITDGNDAPRKKVDIKSATHGHRNNKLVHKVVAYNKFRTSKAPCVFMDTNASDGDDYAACGLGSGMIDLNQQTTAGRLHISRPNRRTVVYRFRPRAINHPVAYEWYTAPPREDECPQCDRAPNNGSVGHQL